MPSSLSQDRWEQVLARRPEAHLLQTYAREELKPTFGWQVLRVESGKAAAQILLRQLLIGLRLAHVPRGPWGHWLPEVLPALDEACRATGAFALTIEPDALDDAAASLELASHGFRSSRQTIQPRRTLVVNRSGTEDDVLARMHPKMRDNIRLAAEKGVSLEAGNDLEAFGEMTQHTASRHRFGARRPSYCAHAHTLFHSAGACEMRVACYPAPMCPAPAPWTVRAPSSDGRPSRRSRIARQDHGAAPLSTRSPARR